ncbi:MAG: response regulator transcription factor [Acidobacteria bacterium]|nr:response regulator transcription factor [Acidobacteriota bacterium]
MTPTLLMVDDDIELGMLMQEFFATQGVTLELCHDGESGLAKLAENRYDLVLLDVMMPRLDGFAVLARLRKKSQVPVLMLTARLESSSRIRGLEGGADDYLPKPFEPMELLARVRAILRRSGVQSGPAEQYGLRVDPGTRTVTADGNRLELTSVEFEIVEVLHAGAGRVVSRDELAQRLYQRDATAFDRAIDVHVSHIRKKLEGLSAKILTVRGVGYQLSAPQSEG